MPGEVCKHAAGALVCWNHLGSADFPHSGKDTICYVCFVFVRCRKLARGYHLTGHCTLCPASGNIQWKHASATQIVARARPGQFGYTVNLSLVACFVQ